MQKANVRSSQFGTCGLRGIGVGIAILFAFGYSSVTHAATATQSGDWSDSATWGGSPPTGTEEDVTIPMGFTVTLDTSDEVGELKVMGKLTVATGTYELICDSLVVMGTGAELEVGTTGARYTGDFTLTLKGEQSENFMHGAHDMGWRALLAINGGTLNLHGEDRVSWTRLTADVSAGASSMTVADSVNWELGDEIVIVSSTTDWNEAEKRTVSSDTNGSTTVNLTSPLSYWHCGTEQDYTRSSDSKIWTADMRAEVGLLTRNITIQGASDSDTTGFGAHVMVHGSDNGAMDPGYGYVEGVEIYRGGQESQLARYPFHWHLVAGDASGQYFNDSAVHDSFNRGITIHGTDDVTVSNNFFYNTIGHTVFLEDGVEENNIITYNVAALTVRPAPGTETTPSDNSHNEAQNRTPSSFWITNPNNTIEYNVAAGSEGTGYWFVLPNAVIGLSANLPYFSGRIATNRPLGSFFGNTAHSNMNGLDIFDRLAADHSIIKNSGWLEASDHVFDQNTWYANDTALYSGTGGQPGNVPTDNLIFRDNVFVDNKHWSMLASSNTIEESLIVADSGKNLADFPRYFWKVYDGAASIKDSYLVGWDSEDTNFMLPIGGANKRVNWRHSGIETDHAGGIRMVLPDYDFSPAAVAEANSPGHPRRWSQILRDVDGTLAGTANTSVVSNHPWILVGDETELPNSRYTYQSQHKFARIKDNKQDHPDAFLTRTKAGTPTEYIYYVNGYDEIHQLPVIVNEGYLYTVNYTTSPTQIPVIWHLREAEAGDAALLCFPNAGNVTGLSVSGTAYISVAEIYSGSSTTTGYFLDGDGKLWVRLVAGADGYTTLSITGTGGSIAYVYDGSDDSDDDGMTNSAEGGPSQDTDGDTVPDYLDANSDGDGLSDKDELAYGLDSYSASDLRYEFGEYGEGGWGPANDDLEVDPNTEGAYKVVDGVGNPYILHRDYDLVSFAGNDISTLRVRYKSDGSGTLNLYWGNENGGFAAARLLSATTSYTANSGYMEAVFNVGSHAEWAGHNINRLRVNTINAAGATTWVDWIRAGNQSELPGPTNVVYVDFGHSGAENGARYTPWNLLDEALSAVNSGGTINIVKDSGDNDSTELFTGGGVISQPVTIDAPNGIVKIGAP